MSEILAVNHLFDLLEQTLDKDPIEPTELGHEDETIKRIQLQLQSDLAFSEDDPELEKQVRVLHGKEMP